MNYALDLQMIRRGNIAEDGLRFSRNRARVAA